MRERCKRRGIFAIIALLSFLFLLPSFSFAISFSFDSYTGAIGERLYDGTTGNLMGESFGTMNGYTFTESDIDSSLGTGSYEIAGFGLIGETLRGQRSFASDVSQVDFNTSSLFFEPAANSEYDIGNEFLLGTLSFTNGAWYIDDIAAEFDFIITASSDTAGLYDQKFIGTLSLFTNSNALSTPEERADWFYIEQEPELGSVRVYEEKDLNVNDPPTGSVELWGSFGSLDVIAFRNPSNEAFLSASVTSNPAPIPEPSTIFLLGSGILGLAGLRLRKK